MSKLNKVFAIPKLTIQEKNLTKNVKFKNNEIS